MIGSISCPLCYSKSILAYHSDRRRDYSQCQNCSLVFVPLAQRLPPEAEKAIYDLHENKLSDLNYRRFLSRLYNPLQEKLSQGDRGLDFGCGPGPLLALMFEEAGHKMAVYDVFYAKNKEALNGHYDFLTATEVIEHLYEPKKVIEQWLSLIKPGGWLGLMTKLVCDVEAFSRWHYKNDLSHVCFYSEETFHWLASTYNLELQYFASDVILLRTPE